MLPFFRQLKIFSIVNVATCDGAEGKKFRATRVHTSNTKVIHFVRHAEGFHNVAGKQDPLFGYLREDLVDAKLTDLGIKQCQQLSEKSKKIVKNAELLVISPLNRTLQTSLYSFPFLLGTNPWVVMDEVREQTGLHPCDRRESITTKKAAFPQFDFTNIIDDEDPLYDLYNMREPHHKVAERAKKFLSWLKEREENEIIVVAHAGYLYLLMRDVFKLTDEQSLEEFHNCELRTFIVHFD
jgi:broad specificity phosphatase PhoE